MVRALRVFRKDKTTPARIDFAELPDPVPDDNEVLIEVSHSSLNYKDALALSGDPAVARISPLVPGIDAVGRVLHSADTRFATGESVVLTGAGLGENRDGGYQTRTVAPTESLISIPKAFSPQQAATLGTAGFTAAQAVIALEKHGIPDGEVLVTGSSGGVGSLAIMLLAASGYSVVAASGSPEHREMLLGLGAREVISRTDLQGSGKPLERARWAGAIDVAGGTTLAGILASTRSGGAVAACGLVDSPNLATTVLPFILRGVALLGINSVQASRIERERVWERLARDIDLAFLDSLRKTISLSDVPKTAKLVLAGKTIGRVIVELSS